IAIERIGFTASEPAAGLDFKQAMDGFRLEAGRLRKPLRGAARRSAEETMNLFGPENDQDGINERGFSHAGPACDDEQTVGQRFLERVTLGRSELFAGFLLAPGKRFIKINGRVAGGLPCEDANAGRDGLFGLQQLRQEQQVLAGDVLTNELV